MSKMKLFSLTLGLLLLVANKAWALTELTANVDRNPVMVNESFILQIVANDSIDPSDLDMSPLMRSGLTVGRTSTSSQTQIINGSISKTTTLSTVLLARQAGDYQIPALSLNGVSTQPISVKVIKSDAQDGQASQPIFLKNTLEHSDLYLQQTTKLVTRLYFAPSVDLQSGTLSDPVLESAAIKQQGKDKETSEIIMGLRYRVIERIYTITPQVSGEFTIKSPTFNGEVSTDRRRSVFSAFGNRKPVSSIGNDINVQVSPIPTNYQGSWLPSDLVQLNDELQPEQESYQVGEPITRTFTLTALNVNEEQLPELKGSYPSTFNVYPDQSESHSVVRQNAVVSQRISSEAIVATQVGEFTLPAVNVNWFNTKTAQVEVATIPARTIKIVAADTDASNALVTNVPLQQQEIVSQACPETPTQELSCPALLEQGEPKTLVLTLAGWVLWLLTLIAWFFNRNKSAPVENKSPEQNTKSVNLGELKKACKQGDHKLARAELVKWGQQRFGDEVNTLTELSKQVSSELKQEISILNESQYSQQRSSWSGEKLWQLLQAESKQKVSATKKALPPLN